jgi:hypothetical protein
MVVEFDGCSTHGRAGVVCEEHDTCRFGEVFWKKVLGPEFTALGPGFLGVIGVAFKI